MINKKILSRLMVLCLIAGFTTNTFTKKRNNGKKGKKIVAGLLIGGALGLGVGAAIGAGAACVSTGAAAAGGAAVGAATGTVVGASMEDDDCCYDNNDRR